ncbi:hypothetical protein [Niabella hibiscisoli]|uniref:hypothetical protein n=1 Tax=Niabella hibiscisoli TaxID=1825928 RepID=UPI001F106E89|nr:hypothetical protein [Niabella hibiscisoli]MCH5717646.1 hypothetical protein [Niabella hibiscisoli]
MPGSDSDGITKDENLALAVLNWKSYVKQAIIWNVALAILFTLVIVSAFYLTVYTMLRQKKLGEIKNDFINNMP